jgi:hypothetical protein
MLSTQLINPVVEWEQRLKAERADGRKPLHASSADPSSDPNRFEMKLDSDHPVALCDMLDEPVCIELFGLKCAPDCCLVTEDTLVW